MNLKLSCVKDSVLKNRWINGSYKVTYKIEDYPLIIGTDDIRFKSEKKPVIYIDKLGIQKEYLSAIEASIDLNVPKTTINRAACYSKGRPIRTGHRFIYKDLLHTIYLP